MTFENYSYGTFVQVYRDRICDRDRALAQLTSVKRFVDATNILSDRSRTRPLTEDESRRIANLDELRVYPSSSSDEAIPSTRKELLIGILGLEMETADLVIEITRLSEVYRHNLDAGQRRLVATGGL